MNRYFLKKLLPVMGIAFAIILVVSLMRAGRQESNGPLLERIENKAEVEVQKMELSETESGDLAWNLKADKAQVYEKEGFAYLQNINLEYLLKGGEEVMLTGERGKIHLKQKNVFLEGNVDVSSCQIELKTSTLSWNREKKILLTEDTVWLRRENVEITGKGMVADMNLRKIRLNKDVRTEIY